MHPSRSSVHAELPPLENPVYARAEPKHYSLASPLLLRKYERPLLRPPYVVLATADASFRGVETLQNQKECPCYFSFSMGRVRSLLRCHLRRTGLMSTLCQLVIEAFPFHTPRSK